jgi:pyrroline-5-carboxylate reductase
MAGIRLAEISRRHNTPRVVRAMPNAAAEVGMSYTPWVASPGIGEEDRSTVRMLFETCGVEDEVPSESDIDYLTGLTGSGSAFPALLAAAMMKDAVAHGLSPETAHRAVNALIIGAGRLTDHSRENPDKTVETFLAYRGTTAAAIETMREAGFDRAVAEGLAAAFRKSLSMGS